MPPQGMPHPTEAEYVGFTSWLAGSLDRAWEGRSTPGRYVVHRLNRSEYAQRDSRSARRSTSTSPTGCRATAPTSASTTSPTSLKTSPLLLERYVATAQRISAMAVGDPDVRPGTTEYSISREFTQSGHIDGLPLGNARRHGGPSCVSGRRRVQAVGTAGPGRGGRLRRRRGQRHAAHVRHHDRRRRSVFRADRRPQGSRGPGQGHERGEGARSTRA